jgi:hypothetical protein
VWDYDERGKRERKKNYGELYTNTKKKGEISTDSVIERNTDTDKVRQSEGERYAERQGKRVLDRWRDKGMVDGNIYIHMENNREREREMQKGKVW